MSTASISSPPSPLPRRDIRSESQLSKRDKDHGSKWYYGTRPSAGVHLNFFPGRPEEPIVYVGGSASQREKVRPEKRHCSFPARYSKNRANKTPKPSHLPARDLGGRLARKVEAQIEANSSDYTEAPRSLIELLPQQVQNTSSSIQTAIRASGDECVLYSFDNKGTSPGRKGRKMGLGGLVDIAEKKFMNEQTERIIKEDYEVLDGEGESIVLKEKSKRKSSSKVKAAKVEIKPVEEDEGFELI